MSYPLMTRANLEAWRAYCEQHGIKIRMLDLIEPIDDFPASIEEWLTPEVEEALTRAVRDATIFGTLFVKDDE